MEFPVGNRCAWRFRSPIRNPGRSALTALGLAIGVGTFIAMVSFGRGARASVVSQFESLGSNMLRVKTFYGQGEIAPRGLRQGDLDALRRESTTIEIIVPLSYRDMNVGHAGRSRKTLVMGTTPDFDRTRDWHVMSGGLFDAADMRDRAKVCVLGMTAATEFFGTRDPLGKVITVDGKLPCRVIGVLAPRGAAVGGRDQDDRIYLPLPSYAAYLGNPNGYTVLEVRPKRPDMLSASAHELSRILRRTHQIGPDQADDFHIIRPDQVTAVAEQIGGILTGLLAGIASVSLLVGGIGIMNIQLVSVAERTHEIGIRAAVGASPDKIMRQFLAEAVVLASIGSAAGVAFGVAVSKVVAESDGLGRRRFMQTLCSGRRFLASPWARSSAGFPQSVRPTSIRSTPSGVSSAAAAGVCAMCVYVGTALHSSVISTRLEGESWPRG